MTQATRAIDEETDKPRKTMRKWRINKKKVYEARTKSEARALIKADMGIPRKGRLPDGIWVQEVLS